VAVIRDSGLPEPTPGEAPPEPAEPAVGASAGPLTEAIAAARHRLIELQNPDGHWCAVLEGDSILESEYLLTRQFLGRLEGDRVERVGAALRAAQTPGGGWAIYPDGPPEVSASVKAYFALKLLGDSPDAPHLRAARRTILSLGGLEAVNSFTRIYLAIFGQLGWEACPAVPPEMVLLPSLAPINLYQMSAWSRTIVVPLSVIWATRPLCEIPPELGIAELRTGAPPTAAPTTAGGPADRRRRVLRRGFTALDGLLKTVEASRLTPLRRRALAACEAWILERLEGSDGLGAIFPPIVNTIVALAALGYPRDHPALAGQIEALEGLVYEEDGGARLQPCFSPVWDTALATCALAESAAAAGAPEPESDAGPVPDPEPSPALDRAAAWLVDHEVRRPGDWRFRAPEIEPSGWFFEYANAPYPDCDDTAQVLTALAAARPADPGLDRRVAAAGQRGLAWLLAMQNRDGGWGAFDRGCDRELLTLVPFADHNAMIDPSTADVTGRVLETLARRGLGRDHPAVGAAIRFLLGRQEADGSWYGRWGVNYLYGTWLALTGLAAHGPIAAEPWCRQAAGWIERHQNLDGGWGETPASYDRPEQKGRGPSTAAQTAWAVMALLAAGRGGGTAVRRGVDHLLGTQQPDGGWTDAPWTGTGFPRVFYLRYRLYATYFPLLALSRVARDSQDGGTR
jgi:squalene-hopene/tetraprenyl-beta-curcumene cyclase